MQHLREEFLKRTRKLLRDAKADDFLNFLTVRKIAEGPATAQFYKAFPGGRGELLETLREEALPDRAGAATPVTNRTVEELMRLVSDLKDREESALANLREVAVEDFEGYADPEPADVGDVLGYLFAATGPRDKEASAELRAYYGMLTKQYVGVYGALLTAMDRRPIAALGGVENLAMVITALFDGLAIRSRLGEAGEEVLAASILPIVAALTVADGEEEPDDAERLYGVAVGRSPT